MDQFGPPRTWCFMTTQFTIMFWVFFARLVLWNSSGDSRGADSLRVPGGRCESNLFPFVRYTSMQTCVQGGNKTTINYFNVYFFVFLSIYCSPFTLLGVYERGHSSYEERRIERPIRLPEWRNLLHHCRVAYGKKELISSHDISPIVSLTHAIPNRKNLVW